MDIEKINYSFGTEYRVFKDKVLTGIVLRVDDTSYYCNKQYSVVILYFFNKQTINGIG